MVNEMVSLSRRPDGPVGSSGPVEAEAGLRGVYLMDVVAELRSEAAFATDGRNARTVIHDGMARVVVSVVDAGREIGAETSDGHVALMVLEGAGTLHRGDDGTEVSAGTLAILKPGQGWSLLATDPFACVGCFWQPTA